MRIDALWIDDQPAEGVLFRLCLLEQGIDLTVVNSYFEARSAIAKQAYDALFLRPDLKLEGNSTVDLEAVARRSPLIPFFSSLYTQIRTDSPNKDSVLNLFSFESEGSGGWKCLTKALREGGYVRDDKNRFYSLNSVKPAIFGWNTVEDIMYSELHKCKIARETSRVDG